MSKRASSQQRSIGTVMQVLVVGVLMLAVFWQLNGAIERKPADEVPPTTVEQDTVEQDIAERYVATDDVNLRAGPGLEHEVLSVVPRSAELVVTGEGENGFVPVEVDGARAWVSDAYLAPVDDVLSESFDVAQDAEAPADDGFTFAQSVSAAEIEPEAETWQEPEPEPVAAEPVPTDEPSPPSAEAPVPEQAQDAAQEPAGVASETFTAPVEQTVVEEPGERWIEVDRSTATVTLHEGERIVAQYQGLLGKDPSQDGFYSTAVGTFHVYMMNRELTETPFAEGVYLTDFVGFDPVRSNGFHSPTRDANGNVIQTGGTATLGCVRLGEEEAKALYDFAFIGMRVEIHD